MLFVVVHWFCSLWLFWDWFDLKISWSMCLQLWWQFCNRQMEKSFPSIIHLCASLITWFIVSQTTFVHRLMGSEDRAFHRTFILQAPVLNISIIYAVLAIFCLKQTTQTKSIFLLEFIAPDGCTTTWQEKQQEALSIHTFIWNSLNKSATPKPMQKKAQHTLRTALHSHTYKPVPQRSWCSLKHTVNESNWTRGVAHSDVCCCMTTDCSFAYKESFSDTCVFRGLSTRASSSRD